MSSSPDRFTPILVGGIRLTVEYSECPVAHCRRFSEKDVLEDLEFMFLDSYAVTN